MKMHKLLYVYLLFKSKAYVKNNQPHFTRVCSHTNKVNKIICKIKYKKLQNY